MKKILTIVTVLTLGLLPSCGDQAKAAGNEGGGVKGMVEKGMDAAKEGAAGVTATIASLKSKLEGITDGASAEKAKADLETLVGKVKDGMAKLGDKAGQAKDSAAKAVTPMIDKLMANPDVNKAIGPVLEKLKSALNG